MLLGISSCLEHKSPAEWAAKHKALGLKCVNFPVDYLAGEETYMAYKEEADKAGLVIAEVGVWRNTLAADPAERAKWIDYAIGQLRMADQIGAICCVMWWVRLMVLAGMAAIVRILVQSSGRWL